MQWLRVVALALSVLAFTGGCRGGSPPQTPRSEHPPAAQGDVLRDDLARPWGGALPARRVISLAPNVTEIVCALGGRSQLAGIDTASDYPPEVSAIPRVGDFLLPSIERVVALRADAVILSSATITPEETRQFEARLKTPLFVLRPLRLADVERNVRAVARLLGRDADGERVALEMSRRLAAVGRAVAGRPRPSVFFEVWHEPLQTAGPKTVINDLIELAGGSNVAAAQPREFPTYSLEALVGADPDVYIVAAMSPVGSAPTQPSHRAGFSSLRAIRAGRLHRVPADPVLRPTPRLAEGAELLARAIHPEAFAAGRRGAP